MESKQKSILDADFFAGWGNHVLNEKELLWQGKPIKQFTTRWLENTPYHDVATGATSTLAVLFVLTVSVSSSFFQAGWSMLAWFVILGGILTLVLPDVYGYYQRKHTRYAYTKDRVLFKLIEWGREKIYSIPFTDIIQISYQEYDDKSGIIHFMVKNPPEFKTYSFASGVRRFHPTFEVIPNAVEICHKLEAQRRESIKGKATTPIVPYETPMIERQALPVLLLKGAQILLLTCFTLYLADFYLLPEQAVLDRLFTYHQIDASNRGTIVEVGGNYHTEKGFRFGTQQFSYPEFKNSDLKIVYSPVFRSVKDIFIGEKSYRDALSSDFNGVTKYFHFATYLVIWGGWIALWKKKKLEMELFTKISISSLVFLLLSIYLWILFN